MLLYEKHAKVILLNSAMKYEYFVLYYAEYTANQIKTF